MTWSWLATLCTRALMLQVNLPFHCRSCSHGGANDCRARLRPDQDCHSLFAAMLAHTAGVLALMIIGPCCALTRNVVP